MTWRMWERRPQPVRLWCVNCEKYLAAAGMDYCPVCAVDMA